MPTDWIFHLPRLRRERFEEMQRAGHERIVDLPEDVGLTEQQARIRDVLQRGAAWISPDLEIALEGSGPPAYYLDFETAAPAIPLYPETRPYQTVPFQWSLHHVDSELAVTHQAFLAEGAGDPRRKFCETLIAALPSDRKPVLVYSAFEATRIRDMMGEFPDLANDLSGIRDRLFDLLPVVRRHTYHPGFTFSYSIKFVAPALVAGFGWDDLDTVSEGSAAAAAWPSLVRKRLAPAEAAATRKALLSYCERDTLALLEVHKALRGLAGRH